MTARWSGEWGAAAEPEPPGGPSPAGLEVLIPTCERPAELAVTLSGLAAQQEPDFDVVVSDQGREAAWEHACVQSMVNVLRAQGRRVRLLRHLPRRGVAEHRDFLLSCSAARTVLFLDDDVWLEPGLLARLAGALEDAGCGFVGSAVQGLSFLGDRRPAETAPFEPWDGRPRPERITEESPAFARWMLHNAANLAHVAAELDVPPGEWMLYKVAWVGACVLFDRAKLLDSGGFSFWRELPACHAGEDVVAQWRTMAKFGGAGLLPSGAVHLEAPTTVTDRSAEAREVVDVHAATNGPPPGR